MKLPDLVASLREDNTYLEKIVLDNEIGMEGSCSPDKRLFMMSLIHSCNAQLVYETGFNAGIMAAAIARALEFTGGRYVGFEIKEALSPVLSALQARTTCPLEVLWGDSVDTVPKRIQSSAEEPDIFFIDGGHSVEVLTEDVGNSLSCVKPGGYIVIDDSKNEPLRSAIIKLLGKDRLVWIPGHHPDSSGMVLYQVRNEHQR